MRAAILSGLGSIRRNIRMRQKALQFLTDSSCSLGGAGLLNSNHLNQVDKATQIVLVILLTCEPVNLYSDGRIWLFLFYQSNTQHISVIDINQCNAEAVHSHALNGKG